MENTSRVSMAALSNPLDINHEEARLRHADGVTPRTAFHVMPGGTVHDHFVERDGLRFAGTHLIIDLWQASNLDDIEVVETALRDAAAAAGATLLKIDLHSFAPSGGITGVAVLAESHISIHTWPERDFAAVDIFMCGACNPYHSMPVLKDVFAPKSILLAEQRRGLIA